MRVGVSNHEAAVQVEQQILVIPAAHDSKPRRGGGLAHPLGEVPMYIFCPSPLFTKYSLAPPGGLELGPMELKVLLARTVDALLL